MALLAVGTQAPVFTVADQNGQTVSLSDFSGQKVVLYFYPKDNTSGCTKEACGFRDRFADLQKLNVVVLGVSIDSVKSHKSFVDKYQLPFTLLADTEKQIVEAYGVWIEKSMYGRKYMGINRVTYLIDEQGNIAAVFPKVKTDTHADELLKLLAK